MESTPPLWIKPADHADTLRRADWSLIVFHGGSSRFGEWPFHFCGTSAIVLALSPRLVLLSSRSPCDARWSAATGEFVPRSLLRKGRHHEWTSPFRVWRRFVLLEPAECGGVWGQQWREVRGPEMRPKTWLTTDSAEIDGCQSKEVRWIRLFLHHRVIPIANQPRAHRLRIFLVGEWPKLHVKQLVRSGLCGHERRIVLFLESVD